MEIQPIRIKEASPLFNAYLNNFSRLNQFFEHNYLTGWENAIIERSKHPVQRKKLVSLLEQQNQRWGPPQNVLDNIQKLSSNNCLAVVAGQQVGIFGGPLYTIYKMLTALKLVEDLSKQFSDHLFVPLFWMETEDNDFDEINHIQFFNKENDIRRFEISESNSDTLKPIQYRKISKDVSGWADLFRQEFFETEFLNPVLDQFINCYPIGESYADAFAKLIMKLMGNYGLILLNPADNRFKNLYHPLIKKSLSSSRELNENIDQRNTQLQQSGFSLQIETRENQTFLFYIDQNKERVRIDRNKNEGFLLKYSEGYKNINGGELDKILEEESWRFSPNVVLRPIFQDYVLPTVGYVAGPAETAYFAQLSALYDYFDLPMPVIYPRHRLTVIERKLEKIINRNNISLDELFAFKNDYLETFLMKLNTNSILTDIQSIKSDIEKNLKHLEKLVARFDQTLLNTIQKTDQKMSENFESLISKVLDSLQEKEKIVVNQVERVVQQLFPNNSFQERVINIIYFLIKYGPDFLDNVYQQLPSESDSHLLIRL
jgi:bacillithiol biosynthesis cysteine-adding enzyme BshC